MFKLIVFCFVVAAVIFLATGQGGDIGPGRWFVINIQVCPDDEKYEHRFNINRKKMNRTHDGFHAYMNLTKEINEDYAIRIDLCKYVDGGCKTYQGLSDESFVRFCNKYAKSNVEKAFTMANIDPPNFPLKEGEYEIKNYMFDYCELPDNGPYGLYDATSYLLRDDREVGCVAFTVEFRNVEAQCGEEEDDDEYDE